MNTLKKLGGTKRLPGQKLLVNALTLKENIFLTLFNCLPVVYFFSLL